jgi:hypothetical protein
VKPLISGYPRATDDLDDDGIWPMEVGLEKLVEGFRQRALRTPIMTEGKLT